MIVGPEDPLANGIADSLTAANISVFGPQKQAAQIESNKDWAKAFMDRHGIPTARWKSFNDSSAAKEFIKNADFDALVVKASGLAAGKGVVVANNRTEACNAVDDILTDRKYGNAGETVVIEELLQGDEVSLLAFCDGNTFKPMLPAQDHKRIFDNDLGPNTGGMGAYCPCPLLDSKQLQLVYDQVLQKTVDGFKKEGIKFVGVLYAGLMVTKTGPKVLEFNCRFGDPETEVILPLLKSDLYEIMSSCCNGTLNRQDIEWEENLQAVGVVMASKGYPETSSKGQIITGLDSLKDIVVFHCGTTFSNNNYLTNGGRVLINVALAPNLILATSKATKACQCVQFDGAQFRHDIAHKGIARSILESGKLSYKESGVDITAGNDLITFIKPSVATTKRKGVLSDLGGFGGLFSTKVAGYKDPILVSGTDGVGTKLKVRRFRKNGLF